MPTLEEINSSTEIYDFFDPMIKKVVKDPSTFNKLLKLFQDFMRKNETKLTTNIVGRQILVNSAMENEIYRILNVNKEEFRNVMNSSLYFKETFGRQLSLTDQLCLGIPIILASVEFKRIGKKEESKLTYLLGWFKPYASRESLFWKHGVKEEQMLYTIERHMSERFDIKRLGTIMEVIQKKCDSSYDNYIEPLKQTEKITDKRLYDMYVAGIASYVNAFLNGVNTEYRKCDGKSLSFEDAALGLTDKDTEEIEYSDNDIASDASIKTSIINKTLLRLSKDPLDKKLLIIAVQSIFKSSNIQNVNILASIITEVCDKMFDDLEPFFSALINSFLFQDKGDGSGEKYTMTDFKTPVFLNVGLDILAGKKSNLKDINMLTARKILKKMFDECGAEYKKMGFGKTYETMFYKALASYWIYIIKNIKV